MKRSLLLLLFLLIAVSSLCFAQYTLTPFDYPGSNLTTARGINNHGDIVGSYRIPPVRRAYVYSHGFMPLAPNTLLGITWADAFKSNDRGDVVGDILDDNGFTQGFLLKDGIVTILSFPGATDTYAWGINESGTVVGNWDTGYFDNDGNFILTAYHGFIYKDGVMTQFDLPGAVDTVLAGINARGDLVGAYDTGITEPGHGFIYSKGKAVVFDVPNALQTQINAINANGQIVGVYIDQANVEHGFVSNGAQITTIDFPGATLTSVWDINAAGQIVGNYQVNGPPSRGFVGQPTQKKKPQ